IRRRKRLRFVGGKTIPEVVKVDALSPAYQRFRCRTVETKVPNARVVVHSQPSFDARQKCVEQRQFLSFRLKLRGIGISDHQPDVMSYHAGLSYPERLREIMNTNGR